MIKGGSWVKCRKKDMTPCDSFWMYSSLPGLVLDGDQHGFPSKDEIGDYLKHYADKFALPVALNTEVLSVTKQRREFLCLKQQKVCSIHRILSLLQVHFKQNNFPHFRLPLMKVFYSCIHIQYKNPNQLQKGNVLVVGGGNSGAQIAVDFSEERVTYLAISKKLSYFPLTISGKSIFRWFDKLGIYKVRVTHPT